MTISDQPAQLNEESAPNRDHEWAKSLEAIGALGVRLHDIREQNPQQIFEAARFALESVVGARTMGYLAADERIDERLTWSTGGASARQLKSDLQRLSETDALDSAMIGDGLVYRPLAGTTRQIALQRVSTPNLVDGLFAISIEDGSAAVGEMAEKMLSIILFQCGAASELGWVAQRMREELESFGVEITERSDTDSAGDSSGSRDSEEDSKAATSSKPRVLVVEDNLINQKITARILEKLGCTVQVAADGLIAVRSVDSNHFDVIFMDCQLPVMDGFEATMQIRRSEGPERRTPIVAVTANSSDSGRSACIDAGMDDYICKPVRQSDLKSMLERWTIHLDAS